MMNDSAPRYLTKRTKNKCSIVHTSLKVKPHRCQLPSGRVNQVWCTHTMDYYSAPQSNKIPRCATVGMNPDNITPRWGSWTLKFPYISRKGKSIKTGWGSYYRQGEEAEMGSGWGLLSGYRASIWGDENTWEWDKRLSVQHCECPKYTELHILTWLIFCYDMFTSI